MWMPRQCCSLLGVCALLLPGISHAGAWLQKDGEGLAIAQATYFTTDEFFDASGNRQSQERFDKYELNIYAEYGLTEWLTVGTNMFLNQVEQGSQDNYGIADTELFARVPLYESDAWVASLQPLIKLPSAYDDDTINLRGGSRSTDVELSALVGINTPILSKRDFIDSRVGYRQRNRGLDGQWRIDATVGVYVADDWLVTSSVRAVISDANNNNATFREDGEQEFSQLKLEVGVQYNMSEDYWLQLTGFQHTAGQLSGGGEGITLGIGMRF